MAVQEGDIKLSANFQINVAKPIDSKFSVDTFADLANIPFPYAGLTTWVIDEEVKYVLQNDLTTWLPSGGGDTDLTKTLFVSANGSTETPEKGNLSKPYQTIEDAIDAAFDDETIYVYPSYYTITRRTTSTNVNMYCLLGAIIDDPVGLFNATSDNTTIIVRGDARFILSGPEHLCESNANNALYDIEAGGGIELKNHSRQGSIFRQYNFSGDQTGNKFILRNTKVRRFTGFNPTTMILVEDSDVSIINCDIRTFGTRFMDIRSQTGLDQSVVVIKDSVIIDDNSQNDGIIWFESFSVSAPSLFEFNMEDSVIGQPNQSVMPYRYTINVGASTDVYLRGTNTIINENLEGINSDTDLDYPVYCVGTTYSNQDIEVTGVVGTYTIEIGSYVIDPLVSSI